jgi:hypothetical protein
MLPYYTLFFGSLSYHSWGATNKDKTQNELKKIQIGNEQ